MAANPWQVNLMLNNYHVQTICKTVLEDLLAKIIPGPEVTVSEPEITVSEQEVTVSAPEVTLFESEVTVSELEVTVSESEVTVSEQDNTVPELEAKYPRTKVTFLDQPELEKWAKELENSTVAGRGKISEPSKAGTSNLDCRCFE